QQVKVIGYDDIPFSALITPSLTTMRIQKQEMGKESLKFLLIQEEKKEVVLKSEIVIRESI
ncbi:MAG: substrate-binding domain-containing protein, partial [Candidatus Parvarchaeota archaeon]|nr:substrate-binding domain-containing protein [Candidatus Jingweiarchaeum tengchongense]